MKWSHVERIRILATEDDFLSEQEAATLLQLYMGELGFSFSKHLAAVQTP